MDGKKPGDEAIGGAMQMLTTVMATLRGEGGCPWDREQTHRSLRASLIEETYEVVEAIEGEDAVSLAEELGDLLLQVVFHSQLAAERGDFDLGDVIGAITEKLIRRHPHVFPEGRGGDEGLPWNPDDELDGRMVTDNWEEIKKREKGMRNGHNGVLDGVSPAMTTLVWAQKLQARVSRVGFDWERPEQVLAKVREELEEVAEVYATDEAVKIEEEIGDLLFAVVNLARVLNLSAEVALRGSGNKFIRRFRSMEEMARMARKELPVMSAAQWEEFWERAKEIQAMNKESEII